MKDSNIEFKNLNEVRQWFSKDFLKWNIIYKELFTTEKISIAPRSLYHYENNQHWETQDNLTIIGDAAHIMPPYAGEVVNLAMLDDLELSEALLGDNNVKLAFENFEQKMLERAKEASALTMRNPVELHKKNGLKFILDMFKDFKK